MPRIVLQEKVNIDIIPAAQGDKNITDISIGDLHANAIKFLYFLVRHGIYSLSQDNYARLVAIYKTPIHKLTKKLLDEFSTLVMDMKLTHHQILIRLMGDELSDRGSNDYFMLSMLQKLHHDKVNLEILLSNHGADFIEACERYEERGKKLQITRLINHAPSLKALSNLLEKKKVVTEQQVFDIVENCYKPKLKIIGYSLDQKNLAITIFSHAGIGLESIQLLARKFHIEYKDNSSLQLANTIDQINQKFSEFIAKNKVHTLYNADEMIKGYTESIVLKENNALEFTLWNRQYNSLSRPLKYKNYSLSFSHGHDSKEKTHKNIYNLDSNVGKSLALHIGEYKILASNDVQCATALTFVRNRAQTLLQKQLALLEKHAKQFATSEKETAIKLHEELTSAAQEYFKSTQTQQTYNQFKVQCIKKINMARIKLEKHNGWGQLLGNLVLAILGLGVGYLIAIGINQIVNGKLFFFSTSSEQIIDAATEVVKKATPRG
jgi:hypothetical protein